MDWRIEQSWKSALEGLFHLENTKESLSTADQGNITIAVKDWWYGASKEKKDKIKKILEYLSSLPGIKVRKFKLF